MHNTLVYCSDHVFLQHNSLYTKYRRGPNGCRKSTQVAERAGSDHSPSAGVVSVSHMLHLQQGCNPFVVDNLNASVRTRSCACKTMQVGQDLGFHGQLHGCRTCTRTLGTCILSESQAPIVLRYRRSNPFASIRHCGCWPHFRVLCCKLAPSASSMLHC